MQGAWCGVQGAGCRVQGAGCRVQGAGCRVQGSSLTKGVQDFSFNCETPFLQIALCVRGGGFRTVEGVSVAAEFLVFQGGSNIKMSR